MQIYIEIIFNVNFCYYFLLLQDIYISLYVVIYCLFIVKPILSQAAV